MTQQHFEESNSRASSWQDECWNKLWESGPQQASYENAMAIKHNGRSLTEQQVTEITHFQPVSAPLGKGSFAVVYPAQTYQVTDYRLKRVQASNEEMVVKVFKAPEPDFIQQEYALGRRVPHLGMRAPVWLGQECYLVMKRVPGQEMYASLIKNQRAFKLPIAKKLELTYRLLCALRDQVTGLGIIHRDIKPENIMVQLEPRVRVHIIDYGLATDKESDVDWGTLAYKAPEMFSQVLKDSQGIAENVDASSDIFSMGRTIAEFWMSPNASYGRCPFPTANDNEDAFYNAVTAAESLEAFFTHQSEAPKLLALLQAMLAPEKAHRIGIDEAIKTFEEAYPAQQSVVNETPPKNCNRSRQHRPVNNARPTIMDKHETRRLQEAPSDDGSGISSSLLFGVLNAAGGVALIAVSIFVLNVATGGTAAIVAASVGGAMLIASAGFFKAWRDDRSDVEATVAANNVFA